MGGSLTSLRKLVQFCRKNGILYCKADGFEFRISKTALKLPKPRSRKVEIPISGLGQNMATPNMDLLLWSSTPPGMEEAS